MSSDFSRRLDQILERVTADDFLQGRGLGNEIPFYAFDYPAERELEVRGHLAFLLAQIPKRRPSLRLTHINLFDLIIRHLKDRGFYDKALALHQKQGDAALRKALAAPLDAGKLAAVFATEVKPAQQDLVLVSGSAAPTPCCAPTTC